MFVFSRLLIFRINISIKFFIVAIFLLFHIGMIISEKRIHSSVFLEQFLLWRANWNLHWRSKMKMEKEKENSDKWKEETVQTYERFLLFIQLTANWFWWNHYILSYIIWKKKVNPVQWFEQCIKSINFNFTTDMTLRNSL